MIRRAAASDAVALHALERSVAEAGHWSNLEYEQILQAADEDAALWRLILVAEEGGDLQGFVVGKLLRMADEAQAEIENLAVMPEARRKGLGAALCRSALEALQAAGARVVELEVRVGNAAAIGLYTSLGFEPTGVRRGYYTNPAEDAVLLRALL